MSITFSQLQQYAKSRDLYVFKRLGGDVVYLVDEYGIIQGEGEDLDKLLILARRLSCDELKPNPRGSMPRFESDEDEYRDADKGSRRAEAKAINGGRY